MTATSEDKCSRRSKGFTIDSIMGRDTERKTDRRSQTPEVRENADSSISRVTHLHSDLERGPLTDCHGYENKSEQTDIERSSDTEQTRTKNVLGLKNTEHRNNQRNSLHREIVRDVNFNNPGTLRDNALRTTSPDNLKHFHEVFMQNASASAGMGLPLGQFDTQRQFRHPLSSLNMTGYPGHLGPTHPQIHPMLLNGARDLRHMYPYFADRYPSHMIPRYGMGGVPGLFFQPYRKPKRIRTAFSPSQLLQLEKSFEKSHYVVGQERKDLANELQLSETQVKVWFQNRRTKYKRTKQEDGSSPDKHDPNSPYADSNNEESDISDIDDIDDMKDTYHSAHAYQNPIQTC